MLSIYILIGTTVILLLIAVFYLARNSNYEIFTDISYKPTNLQTDIHRMALAVKTEIAAMTLYGYYFHFLFLLHLWRQRFYNGLF